MASSPMSQTPPAWPDRGYDMGVAVGDYDNDGYPDLFVAGLHHNTLYHNNGDGTFTDVTAEVWSRGQPEPSGSRNTDPSGPSPPPGWT